MKKSVKLKLHQETLRNLTDEPRKIEGGFFTQPVALCNTTAPSCPECNPPVRQ